MTDIAIKITDLDYTYPLGDKIFSKANYALPAGGFHILLGKNGTGKSTLLHLVMGFRTQLKAPSKY